MAILFAQQNVCYPSVTGEMFWVRYIPTDVVDNIYQKWADPLFDGGKEKAKIHVLAIYW